MTLNVRKLHFSFYFERSGLSTLSSFAAVYSIRMAIFVIFDLYPFIARSVFISFYLHPHARARLRTTRNIRYTRYNPNASSGDIFILMHIVRASESDGSVFPCMISLILGELMPKRAAAFF